MPFYEYLCTACQHKFEEFQRISDDPIKVCPKCKKKNIKKLISVPFKGQVTYSNPKELYEKEIRPDAKRIAQKIKDGDEKTKADIFGE